MAKEKYIEIKGAKANNLKNIDIKIPQGKFVAITGVSGSGKSHWLSTLSMPKANDAMWNHCRAMPASFSAE